MRSLMINSLLVVVVFFTQNGSGCTIGSAEDCFSSGAIVEETCSGSVTFLDEDDKELKKVSHTNDPDTRLKLKTRGGKAIMEGNCCFEARKKKEGSGGESLTLTDANKEYSLSFKVNYVIKADCIDGAGTPLVPILITVGVLAVLALVAVVFYMKKRRGMTQLGQTESI